MGVYLVPVYFIFASSHKGFIVNILKTTGKRRPKLPSTLLQPLDVGCKEQECGALTIVVSPRG